MAVDAKMLTSIKTYVKLQYVKIAICENVKM